MQKKFSEYLKQNKKIKKGLKKKIRKIKAEIKRRKSDEEAVVSLGFLSKVKQFWKKLTFKKQSKTIIKAA